MPQAEARRRRQLEQDIAALASSAIDTTERVITAEKDDVCLDQEGAYHMMTIFQQDLDLELQSGEPVRAAFVYEILANAIEAVREADPEHCFMAVALSPMDDQIVGPALRVVDIWNDEGVWAVLDEGCNLTVCGSEWMERAVEAYAAVGYDVGKVSDETKPFKGLSGVTKTHGSYRIPFALTFVNNNQKLPGIMETHVIDGKIPLLLSQHAQAAMSLVKMMDGSKCTVGLGGPEVELCRVKESGLLCINLSSALTRLKDRKLPPSLKELRLSSSAPTAFPAMLESGSTIPVLISCGKEFDRTIADFVESNAYNRGRTVAASFGLSTRTTWLVNVLKFGDPHHDPSLRGHVGCHHEILKGFFESQAAMVEMLRILVETKDNVGMVVYCNKNRHRSVGVSWMLASAYGVTTGDEISVTHANAAVSWSPMSGSCKGECMECRHESAEVREAANVCVQALVESYLNAEPDEATLARVRTRRCSK